MKVEDNIVSVHYMKACRGNGGIAPIIFSFGTRGATGEPHTTAVAKEPMVATIWEAR
jgi:hypothetical protein